MRKPNRHGIWLLGQFALRHPYGLSPTTFTTWHAPEDIAPNIDTLRGLVRRGWVEERKIGIYYITDAGLNAWEKLR